jgi:type IX secretion system PorP/SprF family membrane protein
MKKIAALIVVIAAGITGTFAQQVPMMSHYYYNKFMYNPALAGAESYGQAYLMHRNQWNKVPGAPITQGITFDGPMRKNNIGIGVSLYRDQAAQFNITGGQVAYRYGINFGQDQTLNFGLSLGFLDNRIDFSNLSAKDINDPVILQNYQPSTGFDANFGVNYKYKKLNVGFSVPQVIANELNYKSISNPGMKDVVYGLSRHFIINANYEFDLDKNQKWFLQPTVLMRATPGAPFQFDVNAMFSYMHKYWVGAMYRSGYAATFSGGLKIADQFVLGYAYDYAVNAQKQYLKGAHEVLIGYHFGVKASDDPELKKKLKDIDDKVKKNTDDIDSVGKEVKKNKDDIKQNTDDIDGQEGELDNIKNRLNKFEDFMKQMQESGNGSGVNKGDVYSFTNVYFETNKWDVSGAAAAELDVLVEVLKKNPTLKIEVAGHTDERGTDSYNSWLSNKRAQSVNEYLIRKGASASQLTTKGYGEGDSDNSGLEKDRRVEFKVLSK